jgi:hypothetical protein
MPGETPTIEARRKRVATTTTIQKELQGGGYPIDSTNQEMK